MYRSGLAILVFASLAPIAPRGLPAADGELLARSLSAAIDTWCRRVELVGNYELLEGEARTLDDARAGRFAHPPRRSTGVYAKLGDMVRISRDYGRPPEQVDELHVEDVSLDSVRKGEIAVYHAPNHGATPDLDSVTVVPDRGGLHSWSPVAGPGTGFALSPFSLLGNPRAINPISYLQSMADTTIAASELSEDYAEVQIMMGPDSSSSLKLRFWLEPEPPVITHLALATGGRSSYGQVFLEDFVQVRGGMVARTVRALAERGPDRYDLRVWRSHDLGQRPPSPSDFLVRVPEACRVLCLKPESVPEARDGIRVFDVSQFTLDDIQADCRSPELAPPDRAGGWPLRRLGLIGMALGAGYWGFVYFIRRRRRGE